MAVPRTLPVRCWVATWTCAVQSMGPRPSADEAMRKSQKPGGAFCDNGGGLAPQMRVRQLRPLDVVALASFQRRAGGTEITAHSWPRVEPESARVPYVAL